VNKRLLFGRKNDIPRGGAGRGKKNRPVYENPVGRAVGLRSFCNSQNTHRKFEFLPTNRRLKNEKKGEMMNNPSNEKNRNLWLDAAGGGRPRGGNEFGGDGPKKERRGCDIKPLGPRPEFAGKNLFEGEKERREKVYTKTVGCPLEEERWGGERGDTEGNGGGRKKKRGNFGSCPKKERKRGEAMVERKTVAEKSGPKGNAEERRLEVIPGGVGKSKWAAGPLCVKGGVKQE